MEPPDSFDESYRPLLEYLHDAAYGDPAALRELLLEFLGWEDEHGSPDYGTRGRAFMVLALIERPDVIERPFFG